MTEVTVISPNIVELVGSLQKQFAAPRTERPQPRPPVQTESGDTTGNRGGRRADGNTPQASSFLRRSEVGERQQPSQQQPTPQFLTERRPTNRPSTPFLTQLIGQQSASGITADGAPSSKRFYAGIAAYQRANGGPARSPAGVVFLSRRVDAII